MEATGLIMALKKWDKESMTKEEQAKYLRRCTIASELHVKLKAIYAKYNPTINDLKAKKKAEMDALLEWRLALYEAENL
jgi:hypothetical protein